MEKKYKTTFSFSNLLGDSSAQVTTLQGKSKAIFAAIVGATYISSNAEYTLIICGLAVLSDTLIACLDIEEIK